MSFDITNYEPSHLGALNTFGYVNALTAAKPCGVVIPSRCDYYALPDFVGYRQHLSASADPVSISLKIEGLLRGPLLRSAHQPDQRHVAHRFRTFQHGAPTPQHRHPSRWRAPRRNPSFGVPVYTTIRSAIAHKRPANSVRQRQRTRHRHAKDPRGQKRGGLGRARANRLGPQTLREEADTGDAAVAADHLDLLARQAPAKVATDLAGGTAQVGVGA